MDTALFCGLLVHLADTLALDYAYIEAHTTGFAEALVRAREIAPDVAGDSGCDRAAPSRCHALLRPVLCRRRTSSPAFRKGVNQSAQGTDKVNAIINCHLATGRIGKPGMGPFSLTGQPNAMGGREVGGLANQLAAHMGFSPHEIDRVGRFWNAPHMARREGLKAVQMFEAIERGEIKALWVMATNPAVSLPRADAVREALAKLDLFVVSENVLSNDTVNAGAQVLLPAAAWGEKDGSVTNSERRISRQRPFLPLPGEAQAGLVDRFAGGAAHGLWRGVRLSSRRPICFASTPRCRRSRTTGARDFDIGGLARSRTTPSTPSIRCNGRCGGPGSVQATRVSSPPAASSRPTARRASSRPTRPALSAASSECVPVAAQHRPRPRPVAHHDAHGPEPAAGRSSAEPFVEVHPADAAAAGLRDGGFARVRSRYGACVLKVVVSESQRRGSLFAPIHWSDETASCARVGDLVMPANDLYSGQPEAKATPAVIEPIVFAYRGFALTRAPLALPEETWWARAAVANGVGTLLASNDEPVAWRARLATLIGTAEIAEYLDDLRGIYRVAVFDEGRLTGCLFLGKAEAAPQWDTVKALFESETLGELQRRALLSGKSTNGMNDPGPVICACFGVGLNVIRAALASGAAASVEDIGVALRAGTNCGSCLPELKRIVVHERVAQTA